jgi:hypothetical protein
MARKKKYFVVSEGSDRAILRTSLSAAEEKAEVIKSFHPDKKVFVFVSGEKVKEI